MKRDINLKDKYIHIRKSKTDVNVLCDADKQ